MATTCVVRLAMPSVGIVGGHGYRLIGAVVDGEVQGDDGVATVDVTTLKGMREVVAAFGDVEVIVPVKRFTSGGCGVARGGNIHRDIDGLGVRGGTVADGSRGDHGVFSALISGDAAEGDVLLVGGEVRAVPAVGDGSGRRSAQGGIDGDVVASASRLVGDVRQCDGGRVDGDDDRSALGTMGGVFRHGKRVFTVEGCGGVGDGRILSAIAEIVRSGPAVGNTGGGAAAVQHKVFSRARGVGGSRGIHRVADGADAHDSGVDTTVPVLDGDGEVSGIQAVEYIVSLEISAVDRVGESIAQRAVDGDDTVGCCAAGVLCGGKVRCIRQC